MLIGEYEGKLTENNRLAIPKKIRESFEGQLVLSRGYEGCLILLDKIRWDNLIQTISVDPILDLSVRDTKRFLLGGAHELEIDKQGRFVMPESLMKFADIGVKVSFLGLGEWVEVWDTKHWEDKLEVLSKYASDIAEKLTKK